jgi:hypothetical protein
MHDRQFLASIVAGLQLAKKTIIGRLRVLLGGVGGSQVAAHGLDFHAVFGFECPDFLTVLA